MAANDGPVTSFEWRTDRETAKLPRWQLLADARDQVSETRPVTGPGGCIDDLPLAKTISPLLLEIKKLSPLQISLNPPHIFTIYRLLLKVSRESTPPPLLFVADVSYHTVGEPKASLTPSPEVSRPPGGPGPSHGPQRQQYLCRSFTGFTMKRLLSLSLSLFLCGALQQTGCGQAN